VQARGSSSRELTPFSEMTILAMEYYLLGANQVPLLMEKGYHHGTALGGQAWARRDNGFRTTF